MLISNTGADHILADQEEYVLQYRRMQFPKKKQTKKNITVSFTCCMYVWFSICTHQICKMHANWPPLEVFENYVYGPRLR